MIYDCFLFNDEFDLLELRMMELGDLVDRFVLVESPLTFQQKEKDCHFINLAIRDDVAKSRGEDPSRFYQWGDKTITIFAETPNEPHPVIEHESRRQIMRGLGGMDFRDTIMLGDVDEIPSRESVQFLKDNPPAIPCVMRMHLYYYRVTNHAGYWNGTVALPRGLGKLDLQSVRDMRNALAPIPVTHAGWHFSWLGDAEDVKRKLQCIDVKADDKLYGSALPDIPEPDDDKVDRIVAVGDDLFGRDKELSTQPIIPGVFQPSCIKEWLKGKEKYA